MTATEKKWWDDLKAVLRRLPPNIELHARYGGSIGISPHGSLARAFIESKHQDLDNVADYEWDRINIPRLDGRDSQI